MSDRGSWTDVAQERAIDLSRLTLDAPGATRSERGGAGAHRVPESMFKGTPPRASELGRHLSIVEDRGHVRTAHDTSAPESRTNLLETIQAQVVPRLVLAHGHEEEALAVVPCPDARLPPSDEELDRFATLAANADLTSALGFVESIAKQGLTLETILLALVGGSARLLGAQWMEDTRSFTEVTVGLGTLQQVVTVLGSSSIVSTYQRGLVVLCATPGEQHTLGLYLLGELFRRAGWGVHVNAAMDETELLALVAEERVDLVGLTISSAKLMPKLARLAASVKKASCHEETALMIGGSLDERAMATFAAKIGAAFCTDAAEAVRWLENRAIGRSE